MAKDSARKPLTGNRRSHSMHKTKHMQKLNKQKVTVDGVSVKKSVKEIRSDKKAA